MPDFKLPSATNFKSVNFLAAFAADGEMLWRTDGDGRNEVNRGYNPGPRQHNAKTMD
jgi:hypothetical protein